jgi:hypothetical protein
MKRMNLLVLLMILVVGTAKSEGTPQLAPTPSDIALLVINDSDFGNFAAFDGPEESKLCFEITSATESVFLGLSPATTFSGNPNGFSYFFRIVDENGIVVKAPTEVTIANANLNDWATADAGPDVINGAGYSTVNPDFNFTPPGTGKYCIEFNFNSETPNNLAMLFKFFDLTVADFDGVNYTAKNGRLYSKKWAVRTPKISDNDDFDRAFNGKVYAYTPNGFVSSIDFQNSEFRGLAFNIAFNSFGTMNTGDIIDDRKSLQDQNSIIGEHLVFLNEPDILLYPDGEVGCIALGPQLYTCETSCIYLEVTQPGQVDIIIDLDDASGPGMFDPNSADIALALLVSEEDVSEGNFITCVPWDGKDGFGNDVDLNQVISIYAIYSQGISHFAVYDVEYNESGFIVEVERPEPKSSMTPDLFYDDSNLTINNNPGTGAPLVDLNGCASPCHNWDNLANEDDPGYGNKNTINTWWQINQDVSSTIEIPDCALILEKDSLELECNLSGDVYVLDNDVSTVTDIDTSSLSILSLPNNGNASINPDGSIFYMPNDGFSGRDTLIYRVCNKLMPEPLCDTEFVCFIVSGDETTVNCPQDLVLECSDPGNDQAIQDWLDSFTSANDCLDLTNSDDFSILTGGCGGETGTALVTFTATDQFGVETTCQARVTIDDTTVPDITECQSLNDSHECDGLEGNIAAATLWNQNNILALEACAFDLCDTDLIGQIESDFDYGELKPLCGLTGTIDVVYTITDDCENTSTFEAVFTITDVTPPGITCPADLLVDISNPNLEQIIADWLDSVTATDECSDPSIEDSYDPNEFTPVCGDSGFQDVVFTATDACNNSSNCDARITITAENPPVITCPADLTLECGDVGNDQLIIDWLASATAVDYDGTPLPVTNNYNQAPFTAACGITGSTEVTFSTVNECQLTDECSANIIVVDTQAPLLDDCASLDEEINCEGFSHGQDALLAWHNSNIAILEDCALDFCDQDLSGQVTSNFVNAEFIPDCGVTGLITVLYTVTDDCGNSSTKEGTFTIVDDLPPEVNGCDALDASHECDGLQGNLLAAVTWNALNITALEECAFDQCDENLNGQVSSNFNYNNLIPACGLTGSIPVRYIISDDCGNTSTFDAIFTVTDITPPSITCPEELVVDVSNPNLEQMITDWLNSVIVSDNCGSPSLDDNYDPNEFTPICEQSGFQDVTFTVIDDCSNTNTCTARITITDLNPPVITCPADLTLECGDVGNGQLILDWLDSATAVDFDGTPVPVTNNYDQAPFTAACGTTGTTEVTFSATNDCDLSDQCTASIIVVDTQAPELGDCPALDLQIDCSSSSQNQNALLDWHNSNIATLENCAVDYCDDDLNGQVTSNFDNQEFIFDCGITGSITIQYLVTDDCGNSSTSEGTFSIIDVTPPEIVECEVLDATHNCNGIQGNIEAATLWNENVITELENCADDLCDVDLTGQVSSNFTYDAIVTSCGLAGYIPVIFTVADDCGNESTVEAIFTIVDNTPPQAQFPDDITLTCEQDPLDLGLTGEVTNIQEECSGGESDFSDDENLNSCNNSGFINRSWIVTDDCGNSNSALQRITITDNIAPEIEAPADIVLECGQDPFDLEVTGSVSGVTDNCGNAETDYSDNLSNYNQQTGEGFIIRTWIAVDACENRAEDDQRIEFEECAGSIGDYIWDDLDGDGIQDSNEPGIPDVKVILVQDGEELACEFTDPSGHYLFENVPSGNYCLLLILPEDYQVTDAFQGNNGTRDNDFEDTEEGVKTPIFNLSGGEDERDIDAGLFKCVIVGDFVWYDLDVDNIQDPEENGINGLVVQLFDSNGQLLETTVTGHKPGTPSEDGYYEFCVRPGCYYVKINLPPFGLVLVQSNMGGNDNIDSDFGSYNGPITTPTFCVISGDPMIDYDAGFYPMAAMGDVVWYDEDSDGIQDPNERGMEGIEVKCYNLADELISTTTTDINGEYMVDYLQQEPYYLRFTAPEGYSPTVANVGNDSSDSDIDGTNGPLTTPFYNMQSGVQEPSVDAGFQSGSLPVELVEFKGSWEKNHNLIEWTTATEINNDHFILERRLETEVNFKIIEKINGYGNTSFEQSYDFEDFDLTQSGIYYYRLKQVDINGKVKDEGTIAIRVDLIRNESVTVYPNPSRGSINIAISALNSGNQIRVDLLSTEGKVILHDVITESSSDLDFQTRINLESISKGAYILRVSISDRVYHKRLILLY